MFIIAALWALALGAIQTFAPDPVTTLGVLPTKRTGLSAADTFTFVNNGKQRIRITTGATECKLKIAFQAGLDGVKPASREIVLLSNTKYVGPFEAGIYNSAEGKVEFTITSGTGVEIEIFE